ncbi:hypothetical protein [Cytobacillus horneckiae]|uniref:Uncharacterized protein n=1 Tax=Cytobacillus horneckiae TaxID=549687 RepID=A0A2N0ZFB5_9BACI|nr:hypothetical protein [Cytobacillus horneckiae]MEC1155645.1 hypothetical protein [Cytobacillus horneckiae]MED2936963.1 hypothetical protein [Cytobacillus horneckiae]PKG28196.1 hypothetical protein CWS20_15245 [Cytobacillus horneckiae]
METASSHISQQFLNKILSKLTNSFFHPMDFTITTTEINYLNKLSITIQYNYIDKYILEAEVSSPDKIDITYKPGYMLRKEKYTGINNSEFLYKIRDWLDNIYNEMNQNPITRKVDKHDQILKDIQERINSIENGDTAFTQSEKAEMEDKLVDLTQSFETFYEEQKETNSNLKSEIRQLNTDIETLKKQLDLMTKKSWFQSLSVRMYNWYTYSPLMIRRLAGFTRELLPEEVREVVTQEALDQLIPLEEVTNEEENS